MMQKTTWTNNEDVKRVWHLVDVNDQILGRAATKIAALLLGKSKVEAVPNVDFGDYVVVINSAKINLSRGKEVKKMYYSHTSHPGGFSEIRYDKLMKKDPTAPLRMAVEKMLPGNKLRDGRMLRLFIYADANHQQAAQQPVPYKL